MTQKKANATVQPAIDGAFLAMMQQHRRGEMLTDLSTALREVAGAASMMGKCASLTVKFSVRPASKGGALVVEDEIKVSLPKPETEGSIFFADAEGNLLREDPNQKTLPLRTIEGGRVEEQIKPLKKVMSQNE